MKKYLKIILPAAAAIIAIVVVAILINNRYKTVSAIEEDVEFEETINLLYGIDADQYDISEGEIKSGQTMGQLFAEYGVGTALTDRIARAAESVFNFRNIRAGQPYSVFVTPDSLQRLDYFVYEANLTDYLVIDLSNRDSIDIRMDKKDVRVERKMRTGTISSSLWNCMIDNGMSPALAMDLSDIYAWSIDFFGLQKGDSFTVIYDERFVDTLSIGPSTIWGAWFEHGGKTYSAIPFEQDGKLSYWDEDGKSLRKAFLKAPLQFSRISSRFSNSRLHPILKIRRPHHGVDYAAPAGTPIVAVGDGVVTSRGWDSKGGGNTLKIKHNTGKLVSGYLHLKGYAKGIVVGSRVQQGQVIGYVGSTGVSTGPHLDFRIWQNGTPIDPLKIPSEPAEPLRAENKVIFAQIKDRILAELGGEELADSLKIVSREQLRLPARTVTAQVDSAKTNENGRP